MVRVYRIDHGGTPLYAAERAGRWRLLDGDLFGDFREGPDVSPEGLRFLPPVTPSKIVCVGLNYRDHAAEQHKPIPEEPLIFIKPTSAVIGPGAAIQLPEWAGRVDHEAELGLVIGRRAFKVPMNKAHEYILGLTCVNDVTARELQRKDGQYTRAKGFDTFAPIGPWVTLGLDPGALEVRCRVNGVERQRGNTADLIHPVPALVSFVSRIMTLEPGDVLATGTPAGVAPVVPGDLVEIEVQGIGVLVNRVEAAPE